MRLRPIFAVLQAVPLLLAAPAWSALDEGTQGDVHFVSGGVGDGEVTAIREKAEGDFNLWLTLTDPRGAFVSGVQVRIEDDAGQTVLDTRTNGPFLLAELPAGRYQLRAMSEDRRVERRVVDAPAKGQNRLFIALEKKP